MTEMSEEERQRLLKQKAPGAADDMDGLAARTQAAADLIRAGEDLEAMEVAMRDLTTQWTILTMATLAPPGTPDSALKQAAVMAMTAAAHYLMNGQYAQAAEPTEDHNPWVH